MSKRMLIDSSHPEETRVVVLDGNKVEEFDFEAASKRPLKGNIYLAKVTRVEPSLQAAFVEYGGNRQGFLAFAEIHPDYYQIPVADRMALLQAQSQRLMAEDDDIDTVETGSAPAQNAVVDAEESDAVGESHHHDHEIEDRGAEDMEPEDDEHPDDSHAAPAGDDDAGAPETSEPAGDGHDDAGGPHASGDASVPTMTEATGAPVPQQRRESRSHDRPRGPRRRPYKIQEVIKRRQIMLVQVVKEERGNKGASLTTYLSLAGRYCVLMPNTPRGGGISRKITSASDRTRLKSAAQSLELPEGMGLIIRTAGANRTKLEIKRDYEYLLRLWDSVRELTLKSNAPALVYEEGNLIKRAIRDLYNKDIGEVVVDGEAGYRDAKDFMRMIMPSHAKNVKPYKDARSLFQAYHVEDQLDAMFSPVVTLKSGGYIVINQTEALVSIDVNSGKATREHNIEDTAYKTNLEAADEIGRQLRLRDLAGLLVIDFIDMEDPKNDRNVEKRLRDALRNDRARIQIGKISQFGLLEMSRQRLRAGVLAGSTVTCPHCAGVGLIRSTESAALRLLRALDEEGQRNPSTNFNVKAPEDVTIYALNQKRRELARIEDAYDIGILFEPTAAMMGGSFEILKTGARVPAPRPKSAAVSLDAGFADDEPVAAEEDVTIVEAPGETLAEPVEAPEDGGSQTGEGKRRRRRRRRGGRSRGAPPGQPESGAPRRESVTHVSEEASDHEADEPVQADASVSHGPEEGGERKRRRRRRRRGRRYEGDHQNMGDVGPREGGAPPSAEHQDLPRGADSSPPTPPSTVEPNGPSAPQWSLAPERREDPRRQHEPALAEHAPAHRAEEPSPGPRSDEPPGPRKGGWWQRRFKIGE